MSGQPMAVRRKSCDSGESGAPPARMMRTRPPSSARTPRKISLSMMGVTSPRATAAVL